MLLVGILSLASITACGKSSEEKAMNEIAGHLIEEAAADGVDLQAQVEQEISYYESKMEEERNAREQMATNREEIAEKYFGTLDNLMAEYENAYEPSEIERTAKEYNEVYLSMKEEAASFDYDPRDYSMIRKCWYLARIAYTTATTLASNEETMMFVYYTSGGDVSKAGLDNEDPENYNSLMMLINENEHGVYEDITIIKNGTDIMTMNCSDYGIEAFEAPGVNESSLMFYDIKNASYNSYKFDYSGDEIILVETIEEDVVYLPNGWSSDWTVGVNTEDFDYILENLY